MSKRIVTTLFRFLENLGAGVWVGALLTFGFAVAGTLFRGLPSITLAGEMNARILHKLNLIEAGAAIAMALAALFFLVQPSERTLVRFSKALVLVLMTSALVYYGAFLADRMEYLRAEIGDFDQFDVAKQSFRDEFNRLHKVYTRLVGANLLMGLTFLLLSAFERTRYPS